MFQSKAESVGDGCDHAADDSAARSTDECAESGAGETQGDAADEGSAGSAGHHALADAGNNIACAVDLFHFVEVEFHCVGA